MHRSHGDKWQFVAKLVVKGSKSVAHRGKEEAQGLMPFGEGDWILLYR